MDFYGITLKKNCYSVPISTQFHENFLLEINNIVDNYGQTSDIDYSLPIVSGHAKFTLITNIDLDKSITISPYNSGQKIYFNGITFGGGQGIKLLNSEKGSFIQLISFTTGSDQQDWLVVNCVGNWDFWDYINVWTTTSGLNVQRSHLWGCGSINNTLSVAGRNSSYTGLDVVEKWDCISWSQINSINTPRRSPGCCGNSYSAIAFNGITVSVGGADVFLNDTQKFNGVVWSGTTNSFYYKGEVACCGSSNRVLSFGGGNNVSIQDTVEKWIDTYWITTTHLNSLRCNPAGCGNVDSALAIGGRITNNSFISGVEKWNGFSWANTSGLIIASGAHNSCGNVNDVICFGGMNGIFPNGNILNKSERWDGVSWSITTSIQVPRFFLGGSGSVNNGLNFGGANLTTYFNNTERWYTGKV